MIAEHSLVKFKRLVNHRGLPLTGKVIDGDGKHFIVEAYGLYGRGMATEINEVPVEDIEELE